MTKLYHVLLKAGYLIHPYTGALCLLWVQGRKKMALELTIQQFIPIMKVNRACWSLIKQNNKSTRVQLFMKYEIYTCEYSINIFERLRMLDTTSPALYSDNFTLWSNIYSTIIGAKPVLGPNCMISYTSIKKGV